MTASVFYFKKISTQSSVGNRARLTGSILGGSLLALLAGCSSRPADHSLSSALPPSIELQGAPVSQNLWSWLLGKNGAGERDTVLSAESAQSLERLPSLQQKWSWEAPGLISDFGVASQSGSVLVSTIRDIDARGDASENGRFLILLDRKGRVGFKRPLDSQTRVQAIRRDGQLAWVSNYEHELEAIESNGRVRWKVEAACRPIPLEAAQAVLCLEDDAAEPERLFRIFDEITGRLLFEKKASSELKTQTSMPDPRSQHSGGGALESLAVKKTSDGRYFALSMTGGNVALYRVGRTSEGQFYVRSLWTKTLDGEVSDLAVAGSDSERVLLPGEAPEVAVLHWKDQIQVVSFIEKSGLLHSRLVLEGFAPAQQIDINPVADRIWLQGSGVRGQFLLLYRREARHWVLQSWREMKRAAEYPVAFERLPSGGVVAGVEESLQGRRRNTLARLGPDGQLLWFLPVISGEGAYVYGHSAVQAGDGVLVATDDGKVTAYMPQVGLKRVANSQ